MNFELDLLQNVCEVKDGDNFKLSPLQDCKEYYLRKNVELESLFTILEGVDLPEEAANDIKELISIHEQCGCAQINTNFIMSSFIELTEQLNKQIEQMSRIKLSTKYYLKLNEKLRKEIEFYEDELEKNERRKSGLSLDDLQKQIDALKHKTAMYEKEIEKYYKRDNLLDSNMNISTINSDIECLKRLEMEKTQLEAELECFHGIEPDISLARKQVYELKNKLEETTKTAVFH